MSQLIQILKFALPAVIAIATMEAIVLAGVMRRSYNWRAYLASLADALGREYLVYAFVPLSLATPAIGFAWRHRLFTVPLDSVSAVVLLVILQDFSYYWFHRCSHRVRWFWATHAIHHSSNEFNLAAAYRFGWTGRLTGAAIFYVPMIWLGFAPGPVFVAAAINLLYQFWLHAEWIPKLGWLESVLNTPSHHRVHHAANAEYLDRNYGGIFIVFDRLFGTFVAERDDLPCRYGLVTPLRSNNPLVIAVHEWRALGRDLWRARSWRERFACLVGPPGDHPAEATGATPPAQEAAQQVRTAAA
ncbi:MAG: sterol desaturase family protein [Bradyrhizobium sp.]|jgi:sterol desaturase/sphingolipid hydroxylase (fatty acid hydroxylase superfamily)|uniref:sterol desaturase family protein n=1 Tax=Bradyrhizobium sp. TaxID=376 RepID=UPI003C7A7506